MEDIFTPLPIYWVGSSHFRSLGVIREILHLQVDVAVWIAVLWFETRACSAEGATAFWQDRLRFQNGQLLCYLSSNQLDLEHAKQQGAPGIRRIIGRDKPGCMFLSC